MAHVSVPQHTAAVDALVAEVASLASLEEAQSWNARARAELDKITADLGITERKLLSLRQDLIRLKANHDAKPAYLKLKGKGSEYGSAAEQLAQFQMGQRQLVQLADRLEVTIDKVPNSSNEQKLLVRELRLQKKELLLEKKEVISKMSAIRVESRQKSAQFTETELLFRDGKLNKPFWALSSADRSAVLRMLRESERSDREIELAPHEASKAAVDEEIMRLERLILWAEKLK
jgi:hypothetical protein